MFWGKTRTPKENPLRALDSAGFDKGAKVNQRAFELQRVATAGLSEGEALTALGNALGNEVAAMIARHPRTSLDGILDMVCRGVREQAHATAGTSPDAATELSEEGFSQLASRILDAAATNTIPHDAICATAKALGVLISFSAQREGCSTEELLKFSQDAVAKFVQQAADEMNKK